MDLILGNGKKGVGSIFLGSVDALHDPLALKHIDSVVSALGENYDDMSIRRAVGEDRYHLRITIWDEDDANISYYFQPVAEWILEQLKWKRHVLVHCVAGHSRSTSLLIYYMLRYGGFRTVDEALAYIQARRPTAGPNPGFMKQLYKAERELREKKR
jgi:protein-tyrosine phosphatase